MLNILINKLIMQYVIKTYAFKHWLFSWNQAIEGNIIFSICHKIHFIKYKEHTSVKFGNLIYTSAPKYL